jgi:hypothetical protein
MSVKSYCLMRLEQLTTYTLTQREVRLVTDESLFSKERN